VRSFLVWPILCGASFLCLPPHKVWAEGTEIPSRLECSASSKHPGRKSKPYARQLSFIFASNLFQGERATNKPPGKEVYSGSINQNKVVKISGRAGYDSGVEVWHAEFSGRLEDTDLTVLRGSLETKHGERRTCSITFLLASDKLATILKPSLVQQEEESRRQLVELTKDLQDKQQALQAAQDDLKKQQADVALKTLQAAGASSSDAKTALHAEWEKLTLATKDLNERQKALDSAHQALEQERAKTFQNVKSEQRVLDGIVLPMTEDSNSWMMRVAAIPVQQQRFCGIVDQFHDDVQTVYQTNNDINKNTLFRDRQLSMAALLPNGEFSNWVVQVKEVTQAPDGSAAVMLQPPCRVMLGSDVCPSSGSNIQATTPTNSPLYRRFGLIHAGDFVVVSGKIFYAEASDQPLPADAVYPAGSHCSATQGSKQEDVFVTEITYLAHLR
jgi:hypothetical protein